ncbi:uncharacterized protein ELE39_003581 [Cryptosporidium sp. chipmunk genotype I]|uniref:uncharacterized protein n=1 Tax=Cryptosporidium sp. chipmunk genotype I TaxID=1280935 RepID=UPI003519E4DD|nr:hypothetical protein ELE39_003581 [Cryptosporidium sp. chipmunk genotype I]
MELPQKMVFDGYKHNNLAIQRLKKNNERKSTKDSQKCEEKLESKLGNIFSEISLRNESNTFKITMSGEIQKITNLSKLDAYYKLMVISYSKMFLALISLKNDCELEDVRLHTVELRKLNFIFNNCTHFNIKCKLLEGKGNSNLRKKTRNKFKEISIFKQEKHFQKDKLELLNKIDSLNSTANDLKTKIKHYFSNSIQEKINIGKNTLMDDNSISINSKSNTGLCNSDSSSIEISNDENFTNSEEETNLVNTNKDLIELETKFKYNFRHRRSIETISFTGNKLENCLPVEFSPAPKYHSRSKTQNTNFLQQEQFINKLGVSFNGILFNKSPADKQLGNAMKAQKIVESANLGRNLI